MSSHEAEEPHLSDASDTEAGADDAVAQLEAELDAHPAFCSSFGGHSDAVLSVGFAVSSSDDAITVVSGGCDDKCFLWDALTGSPIHEFEARPDSVVAVSWSERSDRLAVGSMDGTVHIYSRDRELLHELDGPDEINWMSWHPQGPLLLAGAADGTSWLWNAELGRCLQVFTAHTGAVTCGGFTKNGYKTVVTGSDDATCILWSPKSGSALHKFSGAGFHTAPVTCLDTHAERPILLSGSQDTDVLVSHLETGKLLHRFDDHTGSVEAVAFANGFASWALSAGLDGRLCVFDTETGTLRVSCSASASAAGGEANDPHGFTQLAQLTDNVSVTGGVDGVLRGWDLRSGRAAFEVSCHDGPVLGMACEGDLLVSCGEDANCMVFDTRLLLDSGEEQVEHVILSDDDE